MTTQVVASARSCADVRRWLALAVLALPTLLVSIDVSVMLLALPHITAGLGADTTETLWIMDIYGFMLSGCLLTMGTLGDRIGRRTLLMLGGAGFGLASLLAAISTSAMMLIVARALLGVAGATIAPSVLAIITNLFSEAKERSLAISIWLTCFMGGMAVGPLVGGALLEHFAWGAVFLPAVPVMLVLLASAPLLPESRDPRPGKLDLISVGLSLLAILPGMYGLTDAAERGARLPAALALVLGLGMGVLFVRRQLEAQSPMFDVRLFANAAFSTAIAGMFGVTMTGANMLFMSQYLQLVIGLSPVPAGAAMLPAVAASMLGFLISPVLARRVRPASVIACGLGLAALGALLLACVTVDSFWPLVAGWAMVNLGVAPLVSLATSLVVSSVPPARAGSAAAVSQTSGELAFAFGIAVLGSLGAAVYRLQLSRALPDGLGPGITDAAHQSLAGASIAAATLPEPLRTVLLGAADGAFVDAMHVVAMLTAGLFLGLVALTLANLRGVPPIASAS